MNTQLNRLLQTRAEVDECTQWLKENNLQSHGLSCKDVDLYLVANNIGNGDIVDLGADGSWVLKNAYLAGLNGQKCGIDLHIPDGEYVGMEMTKGDLMNTPYLDGQFDYATCMSVVEHQVSYEALAKECSRVLKTGGTLIMSADFWEPKPDTSLTKLYSLDWNILDVSDANRLIEEMRKVGLIITSTPDFTQGEAVINPTYCSPAQGVSYTFLFLKFIKQ